MAGEFSIKDMRNAIHRVADGADVQFAVVLGPPTPVHLSCSIPAQSFPLHHLAVENYLNKVGRFHDQCSLEPGWLSRPAGAQLLEAIGVAPRAAQPIYFITADVRGQKDVVYIGKTAADSGRFVGGHHAITKLHAPQYDGSTKDVYMGSVLVRISESEWINLELIKPLDRAAFYLSEIEFNLIYGLQPALNEYGKDTLKAKAAHHVLVEDPYGLLKRTKTGSV